MMRFLFAERGAEDEAVVRRVGAKDEIVLRRSGLMMRL